MRKPSLNDKKMEACIALYLAWDNASKVLARCGAISDEARDANDHVASVLRRFRRLQKQ